MDELWMGKYKSRVNYDTFQPEVSIAGVWVSLEFLIDSSQMYGDVEIDEAIREKYGDAVADELKNNITECEHKFVWQGRSGQNQRFKCHECDEIKII
jgi:hypothetical protein